jgi:hypothetical protein
MKDISPYKLALTFSSVPYFTLNMLGLVVFGKSLWTDYVLVLSCVFLGFVSGGTFLFRKKLLVLPGEIGGLFVDDGELVGWQRSLEANLDKKTPFIMGLIAGLASIPLHYQIYGSEKYASFLLYLLNALFLWVPSSVFIVYVLWIVSLEYFWIFGGGKDYPPKLGKAPSKIFARFYDAEGFVIPKIKITFGDISQSGFYPIAYISLFGSILMGIGGAIAMSTILVGLKSRTIEILLVSAISGGVLASFIYPLKKIYELLEMEKKMKIQKIDEAINSKVMALEEIVIDSPKDGDKQESVGHIGELTHYIEALKILKTAHAGNKTLPVNASMIVKLLLSAMAPVVSFLIKTLEVTTFIYYLLRF